jgi:hypothetical protein
VPAVGEDVGGPGCELGASRERVGLAGKKGWEVIMWWEVVTIRRLCL